MKQYEFTDPETEQLCKLLGGVSFHSVSLSNQQVDDLIEFYGYHHEKSDDWTLDVVKRDWKGNITSTSKVDASSWAEAAMLVDLGRKAEHDGLRVMAFLAKFCEKGEDPVKLIARLCAEAGYDVGLGEWLWEDEVEE